MKTLTANRGAGEPISLGGALIAGKKVAPDATRILMEDHRAVRLTYSNGAGEFYGIQQTDWNDAPALADPNEVTTIKGRKYRLYYSGPHLHMVVVEMPDSNVWVINTLLDKLSNETMLSIARSLRRLPRR